MSSGDLATFIGDDRVFQLGRITVNFQHCESIFAFLTWNLIPTDDETGAAITAQLPFSKLLTLFQSLAARRLTSRLDLIAQFEELVARASALEQERNALVHSAWGASETPGVRRIKITVSRKSGVRLDSPEVGSDEIRRIADDLGQASRELLEIALAARTDGLMSFKTSDGPASAAP